MLLWNYSIPSLCLLWHRSLSLLFGSITSICLLIDFFSTLDFVIGHIRNGFGVLFISYLKVSGILSSDEIASTSFFSPPWGFWLNYPLILTLSFMSLYYFNIFHLFCLFITFRMISFSRIISLFDWVWYAAKSILCLFNCSLHFFFISRSPIRFFFKSAKLFFILSYSQIFSNLSFISLNIVIIIVL